jgi:hypothetical protein
MNFWEILLIIVSTISTVAACALGYFFYRLIEKHNDLENFVLSLNESINEFKNNVDVITKSNILVYDDNVFEIMNLCKKIKIQIDGYLSKYDDYNRYIYTEDLSKEDFEPKELIGIIRPHGPATKLN